MTCTKCGYPKDSGYHSDVDIGGIYAHPFQPPASTEAATGDADRALCREAGIDVDKETARAIALVDRKAEEMRTLDEDVDILVRWAAGSHGRDLNRERFTDFVASRRKLYTARIAALESEVGRLTKELGVALAAKGHAHVALDAIEALTTVGADKPRDTRAVIKKIGDIAKRGRGNAT